MKQRKLESIINYKKVFNESEEDYNLLPKDLKVGQTYAYKGDYEPEKFILKSIKKINNEWYMLDIIDFKGIRRDWSAKNDEKMFMKVKSSKSFKEEEQEYDKEGGDLAIGKKYAYSIGDSKEDFFTLVDRKEVRMKNASASYYKLKIIDSKGKKKNVTAPVFKKIFRLVEGKSRTFKEADNEDKMISGIRKLTGLYFAKNGISGLQKELGIETVLFLINEIKIEGKQFDTSRSEKTKKAISMILKNIEDQPDVL